MKPLRRDQSAVSSFYHARPGWLVDKACRGLACYVARHRSPELWARARAADPSLYCLGKCYCAPAETGSEDRPQVMSISGKTVLLSNIIAGGVRDLAGYRAGSGYSALATALRGTPSAVIEAIEASGLRGRGGAGFPTGLKWKAVQAENAAPKYVVANADEGDAGAYSDRLLLEDDPFCLIEAMTIAAYAVGAAKGYIYVRGEYPAAAEILAGAIAEARAAGFLGANILGSTFTFDLEIAVGRGSYLCGEETALLNSIEERRPEPRRRPPWISAKGLWGHPTLMNNVETFAAVPWIVRNGAAAYRALGHGQSRGTKLICLNSLFTYPGVYEVEFGCGIREIVEDIGGGLKGGSLKGLIIGGPLAGIVPPSLLGTRFDYEALQAIGASVGHGGIIAFDEKTSIAGLLAEVFAFGAYESCGKCTPCRAGSPLIADLFAELERTSGYKPRDGQWRQIVEALAATSYCGHGRGLAEFALSAMRYYGEELDRCFASP